MSIEIIRDRSLWDSFVEESPDKLLSHKWDFLKIMEKYSGSQLLPYGIYEREKLISLFPLFSFTKSGLKFLNSQPYGSGIPYNGFLMEPGYYSQKQRQKETWLNRVAEDIGQEIQRISPNIIHMHFGPHVNDIRPFKWSGFDIDINYTYTIDLSLPLESIWNSFDKSCRHEITKAEKKSRFYMKESGDIKKFFLTLENRYREQNIEFSRFDPEYYHDLLKAFPRNVKLYSLYNDDTIVSLWMIYEFNDRLVFWKGGVNLDKTVYTNEFFTWEFIKKAKSEGLKTLDFAGANTQRLCFYKSKFNPKIEQNFSITKKDRIGRVSEFLYTHYMR
jgi:hypothetical protein